MLFLRVSSSFSCLALTPREAHPIEDALLWAHPTILPTLIPIALVRKVIKASKLGNKNQQIQVECLAVSPISDPLYPLIHSFYTSMRVQRAC